MIYLFSSGSRELYRRDVLDACRYPEGHLMRLRYSENYVPDPVKRAPSLYLGERGLLIFADTPKQNSATTNSEGTSGSAAKASADFVFYPIRDIRVVDIHVIANLLFVDVELGRFVDYGPETDHTKEQEWNRGIRSLPNRPCPRGYPNEGHFFYVLDGAGIVYPTDEKLPQLAWRSVIERVNRSSLQNCVIFRILGFYRVGNWTDRIKAWAGRLGVKLAKSIYKDHGWREKFAEALASLDRVAESPISPSVKGADCIYEFKMGELVLLKLLFYRTKSVPELPETKTLTLCWDTKAFTSASSSDIHVRYRYNEDRILLACNRITEPTLSTVSLTQQTGNGLHELWSPQPTFVVRIRPPLLFLVLTLLLFALGLLFLNLTPQDFEPTPLNQVAWLSKFCKLIGMLLVICASWRYLRKFPLK